MKTKIRPPTPDEVFGIRFNARLTQKKAAAIIGGAERSWSDWECGRRNMPWSKYRDFLALTKQP